MGGADEVKRGEYARAIAVIAGMTLRDPRASILVADFDFTIASLYSNAAAHIARRNVENLLSLGDRRLEAIKKLSKQLCKHVDERNDLKRKRYEVLNAK
jgi:hypothetical protein